MDIRVLNEIPIPNPAVVSRDGLDDGMVLVNCDTGSALALNNTGKIIWNLIDGIRGPPAIIAEFSRGFSAIPPTVSDDVSALLVALAGDGFIGYEVAAGEKPVPE